jgi:hypothetical protein
MIFDGEQLGDLLPVLNKRAEGRDIFNPAASLNANLVSSRWDANDFGCEVSTNILPRWGKSADPEVNPATFLCPPTQRGAMSVEINRAKFLCPPPERGAMSLEINPATFLCPSPQRGAMSVEINSRN